MAQHRVVSVVSLLSSSYNAGGRLRDSQANRRSLGLAQLFPAASWQEVHSRCPTALTAIQKLTVRDFYGRFRFELIQLGAENFCASIVLVRPCLKMYNETFTDSTCSACFRISNYQRPSDAKFMAYEIADVGCATIHRLDKVVPSTNRLTPTPTSTGNDTLPIINTSTVVTSPSVSDSLSAVYIGVGVGDALICLELLVVVFVRYQRVKARLATATTNVASTPPLTSSSSSMTMTMSERSMNAVSNLFFVLFEKKSKKKKFFSTSIECCRCNVFL